MAGAAGEQIAHVAPRWDPEHAFEHCHESAWAGVTEVQCDSCNGVSSVEAGDGNMHCQTLSRGAEFEACFAHKLPRKRAFAGANGAARKLPGSSTIKACMLELGACCAPTKAHARRISSRNSGVTSTTWQWVGSGLAIPVVTSGNQYSERIDTSFRHVTSCRTPGAIHTACSGGTTQRPTSVRTRMTPLIAYKTCARSW
jgi:hypothetical protein